MADLGFMRRAAAANGLVLQAAQAIFGHPRLCFGRFSILFFFWVSHGQVVPELCSDRGLVLAALQQDANALEFAAPALRADRELVLRAVVQQGRALQFAAEALQVDQTLLLTAARRWLLPDWPWLLEAPPLRRRAVCLAAVQADAEAFRALVSLAAEWAEDREAVLAAVQQQGGSEALKWCGRWLRSWFGP